MSYKQALFSALDPIVGVSAMQAYFVHFTLLAFVLGIVVHVAGALLMAFIRSINCLSEL